MPQAAGNMGEGPRQCAAPVGFFVVKGKKAAALYEKA